MSSSDESLLSLDFFFDLRDFSAIITLLYIMSEESIIIATVSLRWLLNTGWTNMESLHTGSLQHLNVSVFQLIFVCGNTSKLRCHYSTLVELRVITWIWHGNTFSPKRRVLRGKYMPTIKTHKQFQNSTLQVTVQQSQLSYTIHKLTKASDCTISLSHTCNTFMIFSVIVNYLKMSFIPSWTLLMLKE